MSCSISERQNSPEIPTGNVVYIVGPRKLQNEAVASCLERETGHECFLLEDLIDIPPEDPESRSRQRLVLLDCQGKDPERILGEIRPFLKGKKIGNRAVLFNVRPDQGIEKECVLEGIEGFFYEQDPLDMFMKGVKAIFEGEIWLSREIMTKCIREGARRDTASERTRAIITPRQMQILALVTVGASNDEIAEKLHISSHTVKTHLYNIFKKINVPNRLQAALWAAKNL
jgi:LuxR family transcriptional regulator of csgAB operon